MIPTSAFGCFGIKHVMFHATFEATFSRTSRQRSEQPDDFAGFLSFAARNGERSGLYRGFFTFSHLPVLADLSTASVT